MIDALAAGVYINMLVVMHGDPQQIDRRSRSRFAALSKAICRIQGAVAVWRKCCGEILATPPPRRKALDSGIPFRPSPPILPPGNFRARTNFGGPNKFPGSAKRWLQIPMPKLRSETLPAGGPQRSRRQSSPPLTSLRSHKVTKRFEGSSL